MSFYILANCLSNYDFDADDIKSTFKSDSEVTKALTSYLKDHEEEDEEDDFDDEESEDEDY